MWNTCNRLRLNVATRFRSTTRRKSSSGCGPSLVSVRLAMPPPAVFTAMCRPPSASTASLSASSVPSKSVTSTAWNVPPSDLATSAPADVARSRIATRAPRSRSISADARAIPDAPPTTTANFPSICMIGFLALTTRRERHVLHRLRGVLARVEARPRLARLVLERHELAVLDLQDRLALQRLARLRVRLRIDASLAPVDRLHQAAAAPRRLGVQEVDDLLLVELRARALQALDEHLRHDPAVLGELGDLVLAQPDVVVELLGRRRHRLRFLRRV